MLLKRLPYQPSLLKLIHAAATGSGLALGMQPI